MVEALPEGALWWPAERMLIVADLHLEKGSSFAARGIALPPYDTRATLARLESLIARLAPDSLVALGDSFHDRLAGERLPEDDRAKIRALASRTDWIWMEGNHDPLPPEGLGGRAVSHLAIGPLRLRHEPQPAPAPGEIAGHLHPCAAVHIRGRRLRRRCFASDGQRLIMPAFGAYAGGLNVLDAAYDDLLPGLSFHAWMMGAKSVVPVAATRLSAD
ncbi:MAG: ligase-associated DNA damage response endonuclease PdeM [Rhizobiales bacterium]|nr:ligase-associated DNA damage response endonuclease PdeM [Hyphomicrobiales bacterium]